MCPQCGFWLVHVLSNKNTWGPCVTRSVISSCRRILSIHNGAARGLKRQQHIAYAPVPGSEL